ncbi:MAG: tetraacyldisaccharide 4'-kinase [Candidatus Omnitrophica bacterium]|nr:tetraacyldisaccharide 4'-kinase [Candidatus Omnitrophota bacterium]
MYRKFLLPVITDEKKGFYGGLIRWCLLIFAFIFTAIQWGVRNCYRLRILKVKKIPKPVISIGNITTGGSGKTPLTIYLSKAFKQQQIRPVVLMRGYMAEPSADSRSDEQIMIQEAVTDVPVICQANRYQGAMHYLKQQEADVFILDDGFQHWKLLRDLDIVVIDATSPWSNGYMLPRGLLREPVKQLKRAGLIVLTKTDLGRKNLKGIYQTLAEVCPGTEVCETIHEPTGLMNMKTHVALKLTDMSRPPVVALSSIGSPQGFEMTLRRLDYRIEDHVIYEDHHVYQRQEIVNIKAQCVKKDVQHIITTHKDAVKIQPYLEQTDDSVQWFYLSVELKFVKGEDCFLERAAHILQR